MTGLKVVLRPFAQGARSLRFKYFGDAGYVSRQFHQCHVALLEREEITRRRAAAARNQERASTQARTVAAALEHDGYFITSLKRLGLSEAVMDYCRQLADPVLGMSLKQVQNLRAGRNKSYWIDLYQDVREEETPVTKLIASRDVVDICSLYLNQAPFVHECSLYFTPPGAAKLPVEMQGSQNWHLDNDRPRRIKLFMLPYGADIESGATMFLPKRAAPLDRYRNFPGYFDDVQFRQFGLDAEKIVHFTGAPGAVLFFDTSRLFHCGSRTRTKPRVVLNIDLSPVTSYLPYRLLAEGPLRHPRFAKLNETLLR